MNPGFLFHVLDSGYERLRALTGDGRSGLNLDLVRGFRLLLPPPDEQRAIAAVLDAMDEAIERAEVVIAATKTLRKALLDELLTRGVPGWHIQWKHVPGIGTMPADWEVVRLGDVARVQTGRALNHRPGLPSGQEVPYLTVANVKDGYIDLTTVKRMHVSEPEIDRYRLRVGDVLFTEGGDADKLGRGTVWRGDIDVCLHQNHIFAVRTPPHRLLPAFLAGYAASTAGKKYFLGAAKQTTNLASVNSSQLLQMPLPLPPIEEQVRLVDLAQAQAELLADLARELQGLRELKVATGSSLLAGRVRVRKMELEAPKEDRHG